MVSEQNSFKGKLAGANLALATGFNSAVIMRRSGLSFPAAAVSLRATSFVVKLVTTFKYAASSTLKADAVLSRLAVGARLNGTGDLDVDTILRAAVLARLAPTIDLPSVATKGPWAGNVRFALSPSLQVSTKGPWAGNARFSVTGRLPAPATQGPWAIGARLSVAPGLRAHLSRKGVRDLGAILRLSSSLGATARHMANAKVKFRIVGGVRARVAGPLYAKARFAIKSYWWPYISRHFTSGASWRANGSLKAKGFVAHILSRAGRNDTQMHAASSLSCGVESLFLFTDPLNLGILPNAGEAVLYRAATGLEKAMADVDAYRLTATYAELIQDQWDPFAISEHNLPYLGWAMGANLWESSWSTSTKRVWTAQQFQFKALRGTPEAFKMALEPSNYDVTDMIRPSQGFWASPDMTTDEWNAWIKQMPELRIFYAKREGKRGVDEFFCDYEDAFSLGDLTPVPVPGTYGLVGYWTMDADDIDWNTEQIFDTSGYGSTGTLIGMSEDNSQVSGVFGKALYFDGANQISLGNVMHLGTFTYSAWIYVTGVSIYYPMIMGRYGNEQTGRMETWFGLNNGPDGGPGRNTPDSLLGLWVFDSARQFIASEYTGVLSPNAWHHVVCTYDGGTTIDSIKIYADGVRVDNQHTTGGPGGLGFTGGISNNGDTFTIGGDFAKYLPVPREDRRRAGLRQSAPG